MPSLYERLWRPTIGRPWTYAMRQAARNHPARVVLGSLIAGGILAVPVVQWGWRFAAGLLLGAALGALFGHLYWASAGPLVKHKKDFQ